MVQAKAGPVVPQRYLDAVAGRDPLELFARGPKRMRRLVEGLSNKELGWQPAPGKWSIRQILSHLADGEVMIGSRLRLVAAMDRPTIVGYDQDAFVDKLCPEDLDAEQCLDAFRSMRELNLALLKRLPKESFQRVGVHTERGEESLGHMLILYAGHDIVHERQIEEQLAAYKNDRKSKRAAEELGRKARQKAEERARDEKKPSKKLRRKPTK